MKSEYTAEEKRQALEDFEMFIFNLSEVTETFTEQAQQAGCVLDYSLESLDQLEAYAIELDARPLSDFHGHASQYVGQTVCKVFGGHWALSLNMKENSMNYGKPVIVGHSNYDVEFPPYEVVARFLRRRLSGLLKQVVLNDVDPKFLDLSHLPTEDE